MDLNFGINGSISTSAARPITVNSSTPIAVLGVSNDNHGLHKMNNADDAVTFLKTLSGADVILNSMKGIALQGVNCPIILNLCDDTEELDALDEFKRTEGLTGIALHGGILIAPVLSSTPAIGAKVDAIAAIVGATGIVDNTGATEADVVNWSKTFGTRSSLLAHGSYTADGVSVAASALYAGVTAYWDSKPFGWAKSHSNRPVKGVSAAARTIEYLDGQDCEALRMRKAGVAAILLDVGWRTYGFETTDIDPIWQALDRVRTFNRLLRAITLSSKYARDREASILLAVKRSVVEFMNELKGNDVIIGFNATFDPLKNTKATVTAGKFYLTIEVGDMPSVRELNVELVYSDEWNDVLINYINGDES